MSRRPEDDSPANSHPPLRRHSKPSPPPSSPPPATTHRSSGDNSPRSHQSETAATASMDDEDVKPLVQLPAPPPHPSRTPSFPVREDCWSEDATFTLIEAWGDRYVELNRGNLRQKHWQEVADAVNGRHGHIRKDRRTDIQCKNRIDTLKKKYKVEKSKVLELGSDNYVSPWPFFAPLDSLIGSNFKPSAPTPTPTPPNRKRMLTPASLPALPPHPTLVPVGPRSKRPPPSTDKSFFRRNFSAIAAAASAIEAAEEDSYTSRSSSGNGRRRRRPEKDVDAYQQLAEAIGRFAEVYERVERAKQRQMVELEKQRMQFTKDLELQRMKLLMESQVQLEKVKRSKRVSGPDLYRCNGGDHSGSIS